MLLLQIVIILMPQSQRHLSKSNALSQLLADHTPKVTPSAAAKRPKVRFLMSADCLRMLEEREVKKKKEVEEKEQRRKGREEKKKHREEEAKRKAQEKAKKESSRKGSKRSTEGSKRSTEDNKKARSANSRTVKFLKQ